jgi:UDP-N-acetylmuramoyl-L-alanyl-D-glutamate--2,6-diaminopimelate ligase
MQMTSGEIVMLAEYECSKKYYYSLKTVADFKGKILDNSTEWTVAMLVNDVEVHFRLIGEFNAYNLLAVYGAAVGDG